ncbi:hypothetical protein [Staphylococcus epidermidis]|uniref:hypothetical protein n=1 Tax=Staphylococcus epidermidis TaxID=1282 RepID=UPI001642529F|nr:hypothetical protein [Staphylococcus epidermidis]
MDIELIRVDNDGRFVLGCGEEQFEDHNLITIGGEDVGKYVEGYGEELKVFDVGKD